MDNDWLHKHRSNTNITIVISHCDSVMYWIPKYIRDGYNIRQIIIYSKCGKEVKGLQNLMKLGPTSIVNLPNVGRCDHTYAYFINEHFNDVKKGKNLDDMIIFMKDNNHDNEYWYKFDKVFTRAFQSGFGCVKKPQCDCSFKCRKKGPHSPSMMHDREYLLNFSLNGYKRLERDENSQFLNESYMSLREWNDSMGIKFPKTTSMPVCYLGLFAIKKRQILNQSKETWQSITDSLSRANNIIEGHYAERMWAAILSDNSEEIARQVDQALLPVVQDMVKRPIDGNVCGMASMYYVNKNEKYQHYFNESTYKTI